MKLLVMSDTHGDEEVIKIVKDRHQDVDVVVHCGDSELDFDHPYLEGVKKVRGNCDTDKNFPKEIQFEQEGIHFFATHGHLFNVKATLMNLYYRAKEIQADVVFYGHSHILNIEEIDNVLFINPGSLLKPRGLQDKSYVIVEVENNTYNIIAYKDNGSELCRNQIIINNA